MAINKIKSGSIEDDAITSAKVSDGVISAADVADGTLTSAKLSYPLTTFSSTGIDDNATSTAVTIDSSERVGVGTSPHPNAKFHIRTSNDRNLYVRDGYRTVGGIALQTVNNAESANIPLEINADAETLTLSGTPITFTNSGTERMRIDSSGHAIIPAGVTLGTSAGTYNAANTLDDYEEGTWTPGLETGSLTSDANGYYTKIGRLVYINFIAGGFSDTTSTNVVRITNLPFTNSSFVGSNDNYSYVMSRYLNISDQSITGYITGGSSTMIFYINGNGGASDNWVGVNHNQIGSGAYFRVGSVYLTDV